jgi:hypothetical protein
MQLLLTTKRHFTIALWMPVRLSAATPASLHRCGGPWWDVSRRASNFMEAILSTQCKCILSVIDHSRIERHRTHVDLGIFSPSDMWSSCPKLCAPFSFTLRISHFFLRLWYEYMRLESSNMKIIFDSSGRSNRLYWQLVCKQKHLGRATAQVVIRSLTTAVARFQSQVRSCGICNG